MKAVQEKPYHKACAKHDAGHTACPQQHFVVKVLIEVVSLAGTHMLTVLCNPVKWKPAWNDNPGFRGGDTGSDGSELLGEPLCLLPHLPWGPGQPPPVTPGFLCTGKTQLQVAPDS